ncbi:TPA: hypothetical protein DEG75_03620 [Candidatus Dependentiae bacterium]|nr:hypothetical protein [Candidatus Dependentiae bacterium]
MFGIRFFERICMKTTLFAVFAALILLAGGAWYMRSAKTAPNNAIRIGMMSGWPPYMSIDNQGRFVGFDVDLANKLGKKLGKPVEIRDFGSLAVLFLALEQGKIDMIFSGLDITQERLGRMELVPYTGENITFIYLVFYKRVPNGINDLASLARLRDQVVAVEPNATSDKLMDRYPTITKKQLKSAADMVLDVRTGKSTAFLVEPAVARRLLAKDPELTCISIPLPEDLRVYGCGIAIKKWNAGLLNSVMCAVKTLKETGELAALEIQWNLKGE